VIATRNWHATFVLVAALAVSCGSNPNRIKQDALASGDRYFDKGDFANAIVEYRRALQVDPRLGPARYKLGKAYMATNDYRSAYTEIVRAADLMPNDVDAQLLAGQAFLFSGQFDGAKQRAARVLSKHPKNVDAQILLGNALAGMKNLSAAITEIQRAIDTDPQRVFSYSNLGIVQLLKGNKTAAENAFKRAVAIDPSSESAHLALANYYWSAGRVDDAERELKQCVNTSPKSPLANRALAALYVTHDRAAEAEPYLKTYASVQADASAQLLLADYYVLLHRRADARAVLERSTKLADGLAESTVRLAAIDYADGRLDQAHREIDAAIQRDQTVDAMIMKVRFLLRENKTPAAVALARSAVSKDQTSAAAHYFLGTALERSDALDEAAHEFQEVLRLSPKAVPAALELSRLSLARDDAETAKQYAEQVLTIQPQLIVAHLLADKALIRQGKTDAAERDLTALVQSAPDSADVRATLGRVYASKQDWPRTIAEYEKVLAIDPSAPEALAGLVAADLAQKNAGRARARLEARLTAAPNDSVALLLAAKTYEQLGDRDRAEAALRHVVQVDPSNLEAYTRLARMYITEHRLSDAEAEFQQLIKRQPHAAGPLTMMGMLFDVQNKRDDARHWYEQALAADPRAAVAANNLAWLYAKDGTNLDVALELAQTAKAGIPDRHEVDDTLGWVYYKKGLATLAVSSFERSVELQPQNASYVGHLGLAYAQNGDKDKARETLQRALKMKANFDGADEARKVLQSLVG
jgi:tetratricopeptide (TPR) repeat protein